MKKKLVGITIVIAATVGLAACGNSVEKQNSNNSGTADASVQEDKNEASEEKQKTIIESSEVETLVKEDTGVQVEAGASGQTYTYMHDQWDLYKATFLSGTTVKVENWGRFDAAEDGDPFEFDYDVQVIKTEDASNHFSWIDDEHTAFSITMIDEKNSYWEEETAVSFSIEDISAKKLGSNISDSASVYSYMHDQWNLYRAIVLSEDAIKIEGWDRFDAGEDGDPFDYEKDIMIINPSDGATDFTWLDSAHTAFSLTMRDADNSYWKDEATVMFSIESKSAELLGSNVDESAVVYSYQNDKWDLYKAIQLSDELMKIEVWSRFDASEDGDPFAYEYTYSVVNITNGSTDFEWMDDEHSAFTITMKDEANSYWDEETRVAFTK